MNFMFYDKVHAKTLLASVLDTNYSTQLYYWLWNKARVTFSFGFYIHHSEEDQETKVKKVTWIFVSGQWKSCSISHLQQNQTGNLFFYMFFWFGLFRA